MNNRTAAELASDDDLQRRINARVAAEKERSRVRCRRCRKKIPDGVRSVSNYCSPGCHNSHAWSVRNTLRKEIRRDIRKLTAPKVCAWCGGPLDNRAGKCGPVAAYCSKQCHNAAYYRRVKSQAVNAHEA